MKYDYDTPNLKLEQLDIIKYRVSVSLNVDLIFILC